MTVTLGPIIGHTTETATKVWLRGEESNDSSKPRCYGLLDVYDGDSNLIQSRNCRLFDHFDYTGVFRVDGLNPATSYKIQVGTNYLSTDDPEPVLDNPVSGPLVGNGPEATGEFQTSQGTDARRLRFVFGSCRYLFWLTNARQGDKAFRTILSQHEEAPLDFVLMVGDQVYADPLNILGQSKELSQFQAKYREYFGQHYIRKMMARIPTYMILDDHEIRDNWSKDQIDEGYGGLFQAAVQAYHSYQHLHNPDTPKGQFWYEFQFNSFPFFVADTRTQRLKSPAEGAVRTMLGMDQLNALISWLYDNRNTERLFVVSSVPFFPDGRTGKDKWSYYDDERGRILEFIRLEGISGVTFLSGDVHNSHFARMICHQDEDFGISSLVSSPFYWPYPHEGADRFYRNRMLEYRQWIDKDRRQMDHIAYSYTSEGFIGDESMVRVDIDLDKPPPVCEARIFGRKGQVFESYPDVFDF